MGLIVDAPSQLVHGGDLISASRQFCIPQNGWLDLSTGINPDSYPVNFLDQAAFQSMPYQTPGFRQAVVTYYQHPHFLACNGTQQIIALLPEHLASLPVLLPDVGYQEHQQAWQQNGNVLRFYPAFERDKATAFIEQTLAELGPCHLVVINPNNPTGLLFNPETLHQWSDRLTGEGKLIVDEAFLDTSPELSLLGRALRENTLVLRSFGKFFGLAGIRLGFCFANAGLIESLQCKIGIWDVNGPAQAIATQALVDEAWIDRTRQKVRSEMRFRQKVFEPLFSALATAWQTHLPFFSSYLLEKELATNVYDYFARCGILLRLIPYTDSQSLIRIGHDHFRHRDNLHRITQARDGFLARVSSNK